MHTAEQVYGDSGAPVTSTDTAGIKGGSMEVLAIVIEWMLQKRKQLVKNPPAMQETPVPFLVQKNPLEKEKASHSSILVLPLWLSY